MRCAVMTHLGCNDRGPYLLGSYLVAAPFSALTLALVYLVSIISSSAQPLVSSNYEASEGFLT